MDKPEHNVTGQDYAERGHLTWTGPIIDFHAHVTMTSPKDPAQGAAGGSGAEGSTEQAAVMLAEAERFGVVKTVSMCPVQDIAPLRERFGDRLVFNGMINKKPEETQDDVNRNVDAFLEAGTRIFKLWSAPRGRERGFTVDAPWRIEALKRVAAAGAKTIMVHVGDPDHWWTTAYKETEKFGTKADQYIPFRRMMELFPDFTWIGAHMGGDPEHPDHLQEMLEGYSNLYFDTSATKWQVREVSRHPARVRALVERFPDRFLFGSDLVTRHGLVLEHYTSRYWCQRTLWESAWQGRSPISDGDYAASAGEPPSPPLAGVGLPPEIIRKVYYGNALRLLESAIAPVLPKH